MRETLWVTYAWADDEDNDVQFLAQELTAAGIDIKLDRWTIGAGERLWPQIEKFIQGPDKCDAWMMVATSASLGSEPCKEEFAFALDRALNNRGKDFPVMALFLGPVEESMIPASIRTRLYVSVTDPDWKERIVAAAEGRAVNIARPNVEPYQLTVHDIAPGQRITIEVRPRAGTWNPFLAAIPADEQDKVGMSAFVGPRGKPGGSSVVINPQEGINQGWFVRTANYEATPTMSGFIYCSAMPSKIAFGEERGPQYIVEFSSAKP